MAVRPVVDIVLCVWFRLMYNRGGQNTDNKKRCSNDLQTGSMRVENGRQGIRWAAGPIWRSAPGEAAPSVVNVFDVGIVRMHSEYRTAFSARSFHVMVLVPKGIHSCLRYVSFVPCILFPSMRQSFCLESKMGTRCRYYVMLCEVMSKLFLFATISVYV